MREWNLEDLKEIISLFSKSNLSELVIESGENKLILKRGDNVVNIISEKEVKKEQEEKESFVKEEEGVYITAPLVGVFYRSPAPGAPPFVEEGDLVEPGQTVCIIEAMKLMNEIKSHVRGKVKKILVDNGQAVEFGQKLFLIETDGNV
ncbi:MAG: acetyl-CoA carboxylase biotin carboxyl carrier protein [Dictyoglomus thermophilum]|uniref:Biotin carboxyl carrier protein of acetyl-CoA carboxylase n=1 Tax=Dictyoglomus thermophilum TaxID=14 RepID=A0A7V4DY42_DICTH|nr:acetyl-CoA carboxylase biotin carboxyl carrier protein [Dictyoglomus thermophilum]MCX7720908.1 acetyl-CoA carboxylase biotin carboxyl carrier protein [Dictyoglomus thermophilum]TYT22374.1 acetyl-CoA carboxylase biotin carboxyl carrier protein [Dictyoglomus thermophilum]